MTLQFFLAFIGNLTKISLQFKICENSIISAKRYTVKRNLYVQCVLTNLVTGLCSKISS